MENATCGKRNFNDERHCYTEDYQNILLPKDFWKLVLKLAHAQCVPGVSPPPSQTPGYEANPGSCYIWECI